MQHNLLIIVAEIYIIKNNIALQLHIVNRPICLMRVLPCPAPGALLCFGQFSICFFGIDKRYISIIRLRFFIQQTENTVCTCQCHDYSIQLLADLVDRHVKALIERQKAGKAAQRKTAHAMQCQRTSDDRTDHITDVSHLRVDRSHTVGKRICLMGTLIKFVIDFFEVFDILFLMTEYLYNLLSIHHLFNKSIHTAKIFLLLYKIFSTAGSQILCGKHHQCHHGKRQYCQRYIQHDHTEQHTDDRNAAVKYLYHTLADHLAQRIRVVCVNRHDIAMCMRIKILNRQFFHM